MKLFVDNNLSPRVARALDVLFEDEAIHLRDRFDPAISDVDWIAELGRERSWCVLSGDYRISRNRAEQLAWRSTDLIGFFMQPNLKRAPLPDQAARVIRYWPALVAIAHHTDGPSLYALSLRGSSRPTQLSFSR